MTRIGFAVLFQADWDRLTAVAPLTEQCV